MTRHTDDAQQLEAAEHLIDVLQQNLNEMSVRATELARERDEARRERDDVMGVTESFRRERDAAREALKAQNLRAYSNGVEDGRLAAEKERDAARALSDANVIAAGEALTRAEKAEAFVAMLAAERDGWVAGWQRVDRERDEARAAASALREALERRGVHSRLCDVDGLNCTCELGAALASDAGAALLAEMTELRKRTYEAERGVTTVIGQREEAKAEVERLRLENISLRVKNKFLREKVGYFRDDIEDGAAGRDGSTGVFASPGSGSTPEAPSLGTAEVERQRTALAAMDQIIRRFRSLYETVEEVHRDLYDSDQQAPVGEMREEVVERSYRALAEHLTYPAMWMSMEHEANELRTALAGHAGAPTRAEKTEALEETCQRCDQYRKGLQDLLVAQTAVSRIRCADADRLDYDGAVDRARTLLKGTAPTGGGE